MAQIFVNNGLKKGVKREVLLSKALYVSSYR